MSDGGRAALSPESFDRTVIIGNSGAGKTWLAHRLARLFGHPVMELDSAVWEVSAQGRVERDPASARLTATAAAAQPRWIIEGIYGHLARLALPRATALLWLDLPWSECNAGLAARGPWPGAEPAAWTTYRQWAGNYWYRADRYSFAAHERLFAGFAGAKLRIPDRRAAGALLAALTRPGAKS